MLRQWGFIAFLMCVGAAPARAQTPTTAPTDTSQNWYETAWTPIVVRNGVQISYIFYSEADNKNDGVVLRLRNRNEHAVRYAFTVIFRGPDAEATAGVEGTLQAGEMKTGDNDGLFWIPFKKQDYRVGEIGIRGLDIAPAEAGGRARSR
jgi:hypothetical protein